MTTTKNELSGTERRRLIPLNQVQLEPNYQWCTPRWLRRQVADRRLPFHKCVGKILLDLTDLDELAEHGRVEAVQTPSPRPSLPPVRSVAT